MDYFTVVTRTQMLAFIAKMWKKYEASVRELSVKAQVDRIQGRVLEHLKELGAPEAILVNERVHRKRLRDYMLDEKAARQEHKARWLVPLPEDFSLSLGDRFQYTRESLCALDKPLELAWVDKGG